MSEPRLDTLDFLLQVDITGSRLSLIGKEQWQDLYRSVDEEATSFTMWSGLLDGGAADRALEHDSWDLKIDDYRPGFSQHWRGGGEVTTYHSRGWDGGARPIIRHRTFHGAFPSYFEVDEEFRLYHNLAEDKGRGMLLDFDASGREIDVVRLREKRVEARLKYSGSFRPRPVYTWLFLLIRGAIPDLRSPTFRSRSVSVSLLNRAFVGGEMSLDVISRTATLPFHGYCAKSPYHLQPERRQEYGHLKTKKPTRR